ncbi:hypothetical protein [Corynebacterium aquatimens]|uniref:EF-hand domain-containing protein n=1 Tax=Corynebacterium aquatimens TaxID=1190508 RepID=A0A931E0G3_9CORY|nr:hypothetical protein [Corynebacterium aquatimens]MBG6121106.1 hypothetical protein [Corynebacterium aquatimens]WJY66338.1 hypothetical protein CAQUA_08220 [Corynebacterium aquatimens]
MSTTQKATRRVRPFAAIVAAAALTLPLAACGQGVDPNLSSGEDAATASQSAPASSESAVESSSASSDSAEATSAEAEPSKAANADIAVIEGTNPPLQWEICQGDADCEEGMVDLTRGSLLSLEKDDADGNGVLDAEELRKGRLRVDAEQN